MKIFCTSSSSWAWDPKPETWQGNYLLFSDYFPIEPSASSYSTNPKFCISNEPEKAEKRQQRSTHTHKKKVHKKRQQNQKINHKERGGKRNALEGLTVNAAYVFFSLLPFSLFLCVFGNPFFAARFLCSFFHLSSLCFNGSCCCCCFYAF